MVSPFWLPFSSFLTSKSMETSTQPPRNYPTFPPISYPSTSRRARPGLRVTSFPAGSSDARYLKQRWNAQLPSSLKWRTHQKLPKNKPEIVHAMSPPWLFAIHITHAHQEFLYLAAFETTPKGILLIGSIQIHRVFPKASNNRLEWATFPHVREAWLSVISPFSLSLEHFISDFCYNHYTYSSEPTRPLLEYSASHDDSFVSLFYFLRYKFPKCLGSTRRVLLEEDGYHITQIGRGSFAVISRVLYRPTGETRVMKRISFDKAGLAEYLAQNEVDALKAMKGNKWFPPLLNHFMDGSEFIVTMPYYRRGDLASVIEHRQYLGSELAKFYCAELIFAIHALHKVGIVHRDIKPDNIFLDDSGHLLLADLGLAENIAVYEGGDAAMVSFPEWLAARDKGGDEFPFLWSESRNPLSIVGVAGTFWYTAPEVFRKERYSFGVDYWSVGVIYHELITGHMPFDYFSPYPANKTPSLDFSRKFGQIRDISMSEQLALCHLLSPEPGDRPQTLKEIKESVLFRGVDWDSMARRDTPPPPLPPAFKEHLIYA